VLLSDLAGKAVYARAAMCAIDTGTDASQIEALAERLKAVLQAQRPSPLVTGGVCDLLIDGTFDVVAALRTVLCERERGAESADALDQ
jgi:hypothetical protein